MNKLYLYLLLFVCGSLYGQNQIYLDQISTSASVTIEQQGSTNRIGTDGNPSTITGDDGTFTIKQIGDGNQIDFKLTGEDFYFKLWNTGDNNTQKIFMNGANNNFNTTIVGNSNSMVFNNDGTNNSSSNATTANGDFDFDVQGNSNTFNIGLTTGSYNKLDYVVQGNSNVFALTQTGLVAGAAGHSQVVTVTGNGNNLTVGQSGTMQQILSLNVTGASNTIAVTQGPGTP
jgi:hypothetical protein